VMNPETKQFDELTDEQYEALKKSPDFYRSGVFLLGEEIPLRGFRWKVVELKGGRIVLEVIGQTKKTLKKRGI
jgi:hypothetical protein